MNSGQDRLHRAMENFRATLANLEEHLLTSRNLDGAALAAGYRLILGVNKWVTERYFLSFDPDRPRFIKFMDEFSQWGLGNPDNAYWIAEINGANEYLISGHRGSSADICIELRDGIMRKANGQHSKTIASIDADNLTVDAQGRYQIRIGRNPQGANHLLSTVDTEVVFLRQTFANWDTEEVGRFWIERLGPALPPGANPSPDLVAQQFEDLARRLDFVLHSNESQVEEFRRALQVNAFAAPTQGVAGIKSRTGFFPGQQNALAWWELPPEHCLIVSFSPPQCRYLGFMIGHPIWFCMLDFDNRQNSLNTTQAHRSTDGRFHYVLSHFDPGTSNWIDTGGLQQGFMFFRCQGLVGEFGTPRVRLVPEAQVRDELPSDDPFIVPQQRYEILQRRRIGVHKRLL